MWTPFPRRSRVRGSAPLTASGKSERSGRGIEEVWGLCVPESILQAPVVPPLSSEPRGIQMDKNLSTKLASPLEIALVPRGRGFPLSPTVRLSRLRAPATPPLDLSASNSPRPQRKLGRAPGHRELGPGAGALRPRRRRMRATHSLATYSSWRGLCLVGYSLPPRLPHPLPFQAQALLASSFHQASETQANF